MARTGACAGAGWRRRRGARIVEGFGFEFFVLFPAFTFFYFDDIFLVWERESEGSLLSLRNCPLLRSSVIWGMVPVKDAKKAEAGIRMSDLAGERAWRAVAAKVRLDCAERLKRSC